MKGKLGLHGTVRLNFRVSDAQKEDYGPQAFVWIVASGYSQGDGEICISSRLMSEREIDESVNWRIQDLEKIRKAAKRALQNERDKIRRFSR